MHDLVIINHSQHIEFRNDEADLWATAVLFIWNAALQRGTLLQYPWVLPAALSSFFSRIPFTAQIITVCTGMCRARLFQDSGRVAVQALRSSSLPYFYLKSSHVGSSFSSSMWTARLHVRSVICTEVWKCSLPSKPGIMPSTSHLSFPHVKCLVSFSLVFLIQLS